MRLAYQCTLKYAKLCSESRAPIGRIGRVWRRLRVLYQSSVSCMTCNMDKYMCVEYCIVQCLSISLHHPHCVPCDEHTKVLQYFTQEVPVRAVTQYSLYYEESAFPNSCLCPPSPVRLRWARRGVSCFVAYVIVIPAAISCKHRYRCLAPGLTAALSN